ncbi:MAG: HAMP domain-containing histidine kinase [Waddliaceae bacterium]|jgi:two-component system, OmpR family, phosphate regulon sensor histidine kinase PhoR|nr:HAMP domain-containing histidine kinase [Waddliaceae bacterium]MBT3578924.1 HAMP domain-containing histidine kinase [Waddliaceae bacterium]MBT4445517.1 HAMP domain-containing histidine kinase [Waddliaceae bacterium]MBT6929008.1 HAMP domain-containing histidine kinase [Waddliaceae bacterium]MBT7264006.1 HAMP domain-containing histidine kinase [Waddliaceae bacterium]
MTENIEDLKKKLAENEWDLQKTNEEMKILYKEVEKKNEALKRFDELKSQFVANVSHEFRNPLFVIRESIATILEDFSEKISEEGKAFLKSGKRSAERLIRMVNDLLDIAKIESGKMKLNKENIDVKALIEETMVLYKKECAKKNIDIDADLDIKGCTANVDKDKFEEIIINLLSNAVKFTPKGGEIHVSLECREEDVCIKVSDTGIEIPDDKRKKIFDKFERITEGRQEGTGLGLPITRDIVELHGGKVWVESPEGKGNTFIVIIPRNGDSN